LDRAVEVGSEMERLILQDFEKKVLTEEAYKSWVRDDLEDSPDRVLWNTSEERLSDSVGLQEMECQLKLFDKELQSVECAMKKLEFLVKESEASSVACGREKLSAACSDLEKIRSLKREVEALESSLKFKAGLKEKLVLKKQVAGEHENELRLQQRSSAFEGGIVGESQDYNQGVENRYGPKRFLSDMRLEQCKPSLFLVFRCSFPFLSFFVSLFGLCCGVCC
jgi:hypothetical protein